MIGKKTILSHEVKMKVGSVELEGFLNIPDEARGIVLFAHGSGSSRHSSRHQFIAKFLQESHIATLLFDLLTVKEEEKDQVTREIRFNIPLLAERLLGTTEWIFKHPHIQHLTVGYFGASTGAAACLIAAAELGAKISAIVSRGGRPDLAGQALQRVLAPTLLIVGGNDFGVIELNSHAFELLSCKKKLEIIPNATHLFEEPGTLEEVGRMASLWFNEYL